MSDGVRSQPQIPKVPMNLVMIQKSWKKARESNNVSPSANMFSIPTIRSPPRIEHQVHFGGSHVPPEFGIKRARSEQYFHPQPDEP